MDGNRGSAMLATLGGFLALLLGLLLLLLPLLVSELSRPRDATWGGVVLLLGLVLVTSAERLTGAPMLAVLCGGLLIGRLGGEVAQARWRALSDEERSQLRAAERWNRSLQQLGAVLAGLLQTAAALSATLVAWLAERRQSPARSHGKRWVRRDASAAAADSPTAAPTADEAPAADGSAADSAAPDSAAAASAADVPATDDATAPAPPGAAARAAAAPGPEPSETAAGRSPAPAAPLEPTSAAASSAPHPSEAAADAPQAASTQPPQALIRSFAEVDALLEQAQGEQPARGQAG